MGSLAMLISLFSHPAIACALAYFLRAMACIHGQSALLFSSPSYAPFKCLFQIIQGDLMDGHDVFMLTFMPRTYRPDVAAGLVALSAKRKFVEPVKSELGQIFQLFKARRSCPRV